LFHLFLQRAFFEVDPRAHGTKSVVR
jgi:hypothetical protein